MIAGMQALVLALVLSVSGEAVLCRAFVARVCGCGARARGGRDSSQADVFARSNKFGDTRDFTDDPGRWEGAAVPGVAGRNAGQPFRTR